MLMNATHNRLHCVYDLSFSSIFVPVLIISWGVLGVRDSYQIYGYFPLSAMKEGENKGRREGENVNRKWFTDRERYERLDMPRER